MQLNKLILQHYRNYERLEFQTDHMVNIIVGPNAQGKTNLLEAIFVLAITKSHRTYQDKELIHWQSSEAHLHAEAVRRYGPVSLDLSISKQGKKAKLNGLEQRKLSDFIGALNVVLFAPEDLEIVKGSPGVRRRFMDMELGQVHPKYLYDLSQYNKILVQRNNLLKQSFGASASSSSALLEVWDEQLAGYGVKIIQKRQSFIKKLQAWAEKIHEGITNGQETLKIDYDCHIGDTVDQDDAVLFDRFMVKLSQVKEQELRRGVTLTGPHRDDLRFYINGKEAQTFGSQGQQRTTALSLKLAEIELIHEEAGEYPLLLLDDVLSELDQFRQTQLIETFQRKVQTFITTTGVESVDLSKLEDVSVIHVKDGKLI